MKTLNIDLWTDRTEEPQAVAYIWHGCGMGCWVYALDSDQDFDKAYYACGNGLTAAEVAELNDTTEEHVYELDSRGDGSLESELHVFLAYAEGVNEDGSDAVFYEDECELGNCRIEEWKDAKEYLPKEDVIEVEEIVRKERAA